MEKEKNLDMEIQYATPLLQKAFRFGEKAHEGQKRKSGEDYFTHCITTAAILTSWGIEDENILCAALLHDVIEDTKITLADIENNFGKEVAFLIDGVTKLKSESEKRETKKTLKKVLSNSYTDPRVAVLKLADRLHNMRTLDALSLQKQFEKSTEVLDVYARLAESLGMWEVKNQLEDLAFKYLDTPLYLQIKSEIDGDPRRNPDFIAFLQTNLERLMTENGLSGKIEIRKNGYYNLMKKRARMALAGKSSPDHFRDINDLTSFRVILPDIISCYAFLGIMHQFFDKAVDFERFDEFVGANTRINGYSAIQTTVNFPAGCVEIAIATDEMEEFNNWGVVSLIRNGHSDLRNYTLKTIFTPSGHVIFLPKEATGVDFAYAVNPRLGADAVYLLVDGEEKPLSTVIPNSCTVEVVFSTHRRAPDKDLRPYALAQTQKIINEQMQLQQKDELIEKGRQVAEEILSPRGILDFDVIVDRVRSLVYRLGCQGLDDLYYKIGSKTLSQEELQKELDIAGIFKDKLAITTMQVEGVDRPGILKEISQLIENLGGNVINITLLRNNKKYKLRISIENLSIENEASLKDTLLKNPEFGKVTVV